jgi:hypothetical protein
MAALDVDCFCLKTDNMKKAEKHSCFRPLIRERISDATNEDPHIKVTPGGSQMGRTDTDHVNEDLALFRVENVCTQVVKAPPKGIRPLSEQVQVNHP